MFADGHYRGSPQIDRELVYVVLIEQGQVTLTPAEFAPQYAWKNDPDKVRLDPRVLTPPAAVENKQP